MKYLIPVLCAVALLGGCAKQSEVDAPDVVDAPKIVVDWEQIEERDDLGYFEGKPFTGVAVWKYPNGQKFSEGTYKDGKQHGLYTAWYLNGQKKYEFTLKAGELISSKNWDKDGNPR